MVSGFAGEVRSVTMLGSAITRCHASGLSFLSGDLSYREKHRKGYQMASGSAPEQASYRLTGGLCPGGRIVSLRSFIRPEALDASD
jgi:hypothetical protein